MYTKNFTIRCPIRETINNIKYVKTLEKKKGKYRGSLYALAMAISCPNYRHRIPNLNPGLILWGRIFGRIFELAYRELVFRGLIFVNAYIRDFTVYFIFISNTDGAPSAWADLGPVYIIPFSYENGMKMLSYENGIV